MRDTASGQLRKEVKSEKKREKQSEEEKESEQQRRKEKRGQSSFSLGRPLSTSNPFAVGDALAGTRFLHACMHA